MITALTTNVVRSGENYLYLLFKWHAFGAPGRPALAVLRTWPQGSRGRALDRREFPPQATGVCRSLAAGVRRPSPLP